MIWIRKYQFYTLGNFQGLQYKFPSGIKIWDKYWKELSRNPWNFLIRKKKLPIVSPWKTEIKIEKSCHETLDKNKKLPINHPRKFPRFSIWAKYRKEAVMKPLEFSYDNFSPLGNFLRSKSELNIQKSCHETLGIHLWKLFGNSPFIPKGNFPWSHLSDIKLFGNPWNLSKSTMSTMSTYCWRPYKQVKIGSYKHSNV